MSSVEAKKIVVHEPALGPGWHETIGLLIENMDPPWGVVSVVTVNPDQLLSNRTPVIGTRNAPLSSLCSSSSQGTWAPVKPVRFTSNAPGPGQRARVVAA